MGKVFRWLKLRRDQVVTVTPEGTTEQRFQFDFADTLKILGTIVTLVWATSAAFSEIRDLRRRDEDKEVRLRAVEQLVPQVKAIYDVVVRGERPRGRN